MDAKAGLMPLRLRLPATSANLGPGFDALGLAMGLFLEVEAETADEFGVEAAGRDAAKVSVVERNLILETYRGMGGVEPLRLRIRNEIPLGMGCGSSAAALLAGVMLANHFAGLGLSGTQVMEEACRQEGHPDNVAACFYGGLTASAMDEAGVTTATFAAPSNPAWRLLLAMPGASLATSEARSLLPEGYTRGDAVANVQATALLLSAFALSRPDLLAAGRGPMHQRIGRRLVRCCQGCCRWRGARGFTR